MPITPVFEQPPVNPRGATGIDWTDTLDALATKPGEWARVDGPFTRSGFGSGRVKSITKFAVRAGLNVEARLAKKDGEQWLYARVLTAGVEQPATKPQPAAKAKPVVAVPDPAPTKPPSPNGDFGGDLECDDCDAKFRTNTRLRQHQTNAHKAS